MDAIGHVSVLVVVVSPAVADDGLGMTLAAWPSTAVATSVADLDVMEAVEARLSRGARWSDVDMMEMNNVRVDMMIGTKVDAELDGYEEEEEEGKQEVDWCFHIRSLKVANDECKMVKHGAIRSDGHENVLTVEARFEFAVRLVLEAMTCTGHLQDVAMRFREAVGGANGRD